MFDNRLPILMKRIFMLLREVLNLSGLTMVINCHLGPIWDIGGAAQQNLSGSYTGKSLRFFCA